MDQVRNNQLGFEVEHRRPGLWIVQCRTHLFTIELGQDRVTFAYHYRVVAGKRADHFSDITAAIDFCKAFRGFRPGAAR
jgi:hypothetical protein